MTAVRTGNRQTDLKTDLNTFGWGKVWLLSTCIPFRSRFPKFLLFTLLFSIWLLPDLMAQSWLDGYCYRKKITINETQVDALSNLIDFPVLINTTDVDLATEANGGYVYDSNGWDIVFTSDDGTTRLDHEVEKYDPFSGEYVAWIKIPVLYWDFNTEIYIYFGNNSHS